MGRVRSGAEVGMTGIAIFLLGFASGCVVCVLLACAAANVTEGVSE